MLQPPEGRSDAATVSEYGLTDREHDVLRLLAAGLRNRSIADELYIGSETVKSHLKSIYRKLGVSSRGEAAAMVLRDRDDERTGEPNRERRS